MKNRNLNFYQVANRIMAGQCSSFRYGEARWWTVTPDMRIKKISEKGMTIDAYIKKNPRIIHERGFEVRP